jgi:hypothetical protein
MADYNSSLPIRTENAGDVAIKIVDSTITSQQLTVNADGSINTNVSATNLDIRDLVFATDKVDVSGSSVELGATTLAALESITVQNGSGVSAVNIQDGGNSITVDGTVELGATSLAALESITVQNGAGGSAVNIQDGGNSITVDGSVTVSATALDIRPLVPATDSVKISDGTDSLAINADGSLNVVVTSSVAGTPVCDFLSSSAVAAGASANHDYTVTAATTLKLTGILASASGKCKVEVKVESGVGTGIFNTKFVGFNSTATPNVTIFPTGDLMVAAGVKVRVAMTNKDNQAQDLYSTIEGSEV